jgi:hypothetical protein
MSLLANSTLDRAHVPSGIFAAVSRSTRPQSLKHAALALFAAWACGCSSTDGVGNHPGNGVAPSGLDASPDSGGGVTVPPDDAGALGVDAWEGATAVGSDASIGSPESGDQGDAGPAGAAEAAPLAPGNFACNEFIGLWVASQWWGAFEKDIGDMRWQLMFQHHGYLELFADPASAYWKNPIVNPPCAMHSAAPDRVVFLPFSLTLNTLDQWQTSLRKVVSNIKQVFPSAKRIEIVSTLRSPNNMLCPNDKDPGTIVAPYVDQAIQTVADESPGLVVAGPKIAVTDCAWWGGGTDLTGQGNAGVAQLYAAYYKANP